MTETENSFTRDDTTTTTAMTAALAQPCSPSSSVGWIQRRVGGGSRSHSMVFLSFHKVLLPLILLGTQELQPAMGESTACLVCEPKLRALRTF